MKSILPIQWLRTGLAVLALLGAGVSTLADFTQAVDSTLLAEGTTLRFPKQPVLGGVGGNPWIWLQFLDDHGAAASDEIFLGRCVQDSQ